MTTPTGSRLREISEQLGKEMAALENNIRALEGSLEGKPSNGTQLNESITLAKTNLAETEFAKEGVDGLIEKLPKVKVPGPNEPPASGTRATAG